MHVQLRSASSSGRTNPRRRRSHRQTFNRRRTTPGKAVQYRPEILLSLFDLLAWRHVNCKTSEDYEDVKIQSQGLIVLLCLVNLLNYIDRGIIPGAPQSFRHFIMSSLDVAVTEQSVYFGLLSSSFIIVHSVLSIVFGYFALTHRPLHWERVSGSWPS